MKGAGFGFGMDSGFHTSRMLFQKKIVVEMSMRSLLCDMSFAGIYVLSLRMTDEGMGHAEFMLERHLGYSENMQISETEKAVKGTERKTGIDGT